MRKSIPTRKALVALAAVLGIFAFATASPASADTPDTITGVILVGDQEFIIDEQTDGPCPSEVEIDIDFSGSATSGTWTAVGNMKAPFQITGSAAWFQAEIDLSGSGGYSAPFSGSILATMKLQDLDPDGADNIADTEDDCGKTDKCTAGTQLIVDASSSHTGTLPTPAPGDVTNLIADSSLSGGFPMTLLGSCGVTLAGALANEHVFADLNLNW